MPRQAKKTVDEIYIALKDFCFVGDNAYLPYSHPIW